MAKQTHKIKVGALYIGGGAPVTIQSMTNTRTQNVEATGAQIAALCEAGCDIVRVSVYDMACAKAISALKQYGTAPLVADIHFDYKLAVAAVENGIDKLRINPGNIGGADNVRTLAACARAHGVPIRVGVNSGSVERELLAKYGGPTPDALAESALGHVKLLEDAGFSDIVISAKASNVPDTVRVYRRLSEVCDYPLHLGVTEAGGGDAALVKGAMGIGALLLDGIGDTVRVSMTGDPVQEVYAARRILAAAGVRSQGVNIISCPTCGRTRSDVEGIAARVERELEDCAQNGHITVAVMGCAVNGPGEAREADIGVALGRDNGVVFARGEKVLAAPLEQAVQALITMAKEMLS